MIKLHLFVLKEKIYTSLEEGVVARSVVSATWEVVAVGPVQ